MSVEEDISTSLTEDSDCPGDTTSSLHYIEQELHTLGLPPIVTQVNSGLDETKTLEVLQKLFLLHRHNLKIITEQRDNLTRGKSDLILQREAQARLKEDIKSGEKELAMLEDRERQLNQKVKTLSSKLKAEQDEVRRLKVSIQYKETQRIHENKKREKEFERLKLKLGQLVSDKSHERRLGMSMPNALQKTDGKRKMWVKPGSGDEDVYRVMISNYEERQKELILENASLRESLAGMGKQLVCLLNEKQATLLLQDQSQGLNRTDESEQVINNGANLVSSGHFQMPYDIVRDGIEQNFQEKCRLVKEHIDDLKLRIERLEANQGEDFMESESEIRKLEHKLSDYRNIIGQQEEMLLQKSLNSEEEQHSDVLSDSHLWHKTNKLEEERRLFFQQKENFESERQKFMEAVHELDRERCTFENQKSVFSHEQECLLNSTQELDSFFTKLCSTPAKASDCSMSKYLVHRQTTSGSEAASPTSSSVLQDSTTARQDVDLRHDLSMCSDDGTSVLNERPGSN